MKTRILIGAVLLALTFALSSQKLSFAGAAAGDTAQDFNLPKADGGTCSLSDFKGKSNVFVMFWTINGMYCAYELEGLRDRYAELQKNGFEVIAVNKKEEAAKVKDFIAKEKLPFPVLLDAEGKVAKMYSINALPVMLIIDKKGQIQWRGYQFPLNYLKYVKE